jgi:Protein of unknown function (DUF2971)
MPEATNFGTEALALASAIFPSLFDIDPERIFKGGTRRLAYYTSAKTASSLISKSTLWLRNVRMMNDSSEVHHGLESIYSAFNGEEGARRIKMISEGSRCFEQVLQTFFNNGEASYLSMNTYAMSFSNHLPREDSIGRLSMWRGYGDQSKVAVVFNTKSFMNRNANFPVMAGFVRYWSVAQLVNELDSAVQKLNEYRSRLNSLPEDYQKRIFWAYLSAVGVLTKHPGFAEEREFRIFCGNLDSSTPGLSTEIEFPEGVPQKVAKLKIQNYESYGIPMTTLQDILDKIIVGPSSSAVAMRDAFIALLTEANIENPEKKVVLSNIPFRASL